MALSKVFPNLEGNHVHQWFHLDLKRILGIEDLLSAETGDKIWKLAEECFRREDMWPQGPVSYTHLLPLPISNKGAEFSSPA